jgi:hypothetical protein
MCAMAGGSKWPVFFCVNFTPIFHDNQPLLFYHRKDNEYNQCQKKRCHARKTTFGESLFIKSSAKIFHYFKNRVPYIENTLVGLLPFETYVVKELPDRKFTTSKNLCTICVQ